MVETKCAIQLPRGVICSILQGSTYFSGDFSLSGPVVLKAHDIQLISATKLKEPLISRAPLTTVILPPLSIERGGGEGGKTIEGYLDPNENRSSKFITLTLQDGSRLTTKFEQMITEPYRTFTFTPNDNQLISLELKYRDGLSFKVKSQIITSNDKVITVKQSLKLVSHFPCDISDIKDLRISFQPGRSNDYERYASAAPMLAARSAEESTQIKEAVGNIAAPVSLGPIDFLPKMAAKYFDLPNVDLKIDDVYYDIYAQNLQVMMVFKLTPQSTLYPSTIEVIDQQSKAPTLAFDVNLQIKDSTFEAEIGAAQGIQIKESVVEEHKFKITLISTLNVPVKIRIKGSYMFKGRVFEYTLPPQTTTIFEEAY